MLPKLALHYYTYIGSSPPLQQIMATRKIERLCYIRCFYSRCNWPPDDRGEKPCENYSTDLSIDPATLSVYYMCAACVPRYTKEHPTHVANIE